MQVIVKFVKEWLKLYKNMTEQIGSVQELVDKSKVEKQLNSVNKDKRDNLG